MQETGLNSKLEFWPICLPIFLKVINAGLRKKGRTKKNMIKVGLARPPGPAGQANGTGLKGLQSK